MLGWTVLHHAVPETNCANATVLFFLWATGAGTVRSVRHPEEAVDVYLCVCLHVSVYMCIRVCVCGTNIGQAVIDSGLSLTIKL